VGDRLGTEDVRRILSILDASTFDELKIETPDFKLSLRRGSAGVVNEPPTTEPVRAAPPSQAPAPAPVVAPASADLFEVKAPMLGVFYRAPKPGAAPFVEVGAKVEPDTVIGIVEVMKLMNSISAEVAGEVVEVVARDAQIVEYGHALVRIRRR